jgi:APA family basic amino acid/polyamine antiporter
VFSIGMLAGAGIAASGLSLVLMIAGLPLYWWTRRKAAKEPTGPAWAP